MKRTFVLILAGLAVAALFGGLVHAVLVAAHVAEPAATTVYGLTSRRVWATAVVLLAGAGVIIGGLALSRPASRFGTARLGAIAAVAMGFVAVVNGGLVLSIADGGPGTGNGVVGGAAAVVLGLIAIAIGGVALVRRGGLVTAAQQPVAIFSLHGVRYQVMDVARAADFYTRHLGFTLEIHYPPAFASVSLEHFTLLLSGPGASGSRPMPSGDAQQPGGWNRVVLRVADLPAQIDALKRAGVKFRNQIERGPGGRQIQIEDPDGNPIELFETDRQPAVHDRDV